MIEEAYNDSKNNAGQSSSTTQSDDSMHVEMAAKSQTSSMSQDINPIEGDVVAEWDRESTRRLFELYEKHGPKWTHIAKEIGNKYKYKYD